LSSWDRVPLPAELVKQIKVIVGREPGFTSVAEFVREAVRRLLKEWRAAALTVVKGDVIKLLTAGVLTPGEATLFLFCVDESGTFYVNALEAAMRLKNTCEFGDICQACWKILDALQGGEEGG